jgi:PAS domain S-box-containing protein
LKQSELALGKYAQTAGEKLRDSEQRLQESSWRLAEFEERLRAEAALRHSREQMEIVVEGANVGVWYCPLRFDELIWDEKVKEHFHLPPDAKVTIDTFYKRLHPDDRERTRLSIETSIANRQAYDIDYRTVSPDGRDVKWIRASGRGFYDDAGNPTRFDGITIDVTDRIRAEQALKASEEKLRLALQTGKLGVWSLDLTTWEMTCSETCKANYGRLAGERFSYADLRESIHPADRQRVEAQVRDAIAGRTDYDSEYRTIWPDGGTHWVLCRGRASYATDGTPLTLTGVSLDISERQAAEEQRAALLEAERAARAEAERASRMKDDFLATLSHELRTPLNAILGWSQVLSRNGGRDEQDLKEGLRTIERNARAQTQIIEDLLDMSRIISGKVRLEVQRVELAALLEDAVNTVRPAADAKQIRLQTVLDSASAFVSGDPSRLQQVFWNLLTNAIKFTARDGRVRVLLERVNSHLEVSVADTGEGIAPEFLPYVFDRFRQADASITRRHGGLGLGLAIVKQLVELHGGSVRATSLGLGQGSTFLVMLPLAAIHTDQPSEPDRRHPKASSTAAKAEAGCVTLDGVKVLVVDDEPDARALVKRLLEECQATTFTAGSAAEALELVRLERPAVLVSDIGMPVEDGYSLIRKVRALGKENGGDTPAVALTAYARSEDRVRALRHGFQMHVAKPVDAAELVTVVASLSGRAEPPDAP